MTVGWPLGEASAGWRDAAIRGMHAPGAEQRRSASTLLIEQLAASKDPVLAYKSNLLAGLDPHSAKARSMRERVPSSPIARALLRVFGQDAKTLRHTYLKWQGPHWTLTCLVMIDYPAGDERLLEAKQLPGGGFPLEAPNTVTADHVISRGSYADWGPSGLRHCNPLVSLAALAVLRNDWRSPSSPRR
jgi:hypothetical protein